MTQTSKTDPLLGRLVDGRYLITRRIARGGMATVYLADDQRLTRTVAIKVMHENLGEDEDFVARFDREARAAARLSHPNVVSVFDQGMDDGRPYIVMEYVEGSTLRQVMTREAPLAPSRALALIHQVAEAVAAAHEAGIVHRDLKPENVLISRRGQLKVADFGLARAVTAHTATANGMLIGTVSYIAPELVTHGHADTRCDVYAMGVVLYEMLTGIKPHTGESPIQVAYSHVHNEITPPSQAAPAQWRGTSHGVPDYVDALVMAAAARQPADRPHDAAVLADHIAAARDAIAQGRLQDPALAARMRDTVLDDDALNDDVLDTESVPMAAPAFAERANPTLVFDPHAAAESPGHPAVVAATDPEPALPSPSARPLQQRRARKSRTARTSLVVLLVIALALGVGAWYLMAGRFTTAPDFTNLTQEEAIALAAKQGFPVQFDADYSETIAAGKVVRTDPAAGERIAYGGTITAFLSRGPERYAVPSLAGRTVDEATQALSDAHLTLGKVTEVWSDSIQSGKVVSCSPNTGKVVKPKTEVDLKVSKGPAPIKVVSYVNKPFTEAKAYYEGKGVVVEQSAEKNSDTIPAGNVISQSPKDGSIDKGGKITFVVSKGPVLVAVPDVVGMNANQAQKTLTAAGFEVKWEKVFWARSVWSTDPAPGTMAPKGSTVTVKLA